VATVLQVSRAAPTPAALQYHSRGPFYTAFPCCVHTRKAVVYSNTHGASHASPRICHLKEALELFDHATLKSEIFDQQTIIVR